MGDGFAMPAAEVVFDPSGAFARPTSAQFIPFPGQKPAGAGPTIPIVGVVAIAATLFLLEHLRPKGGKA